MTDTTQLQAPTGTPTAQPRRARIATVWLGGCSGCHMSFLDLDEWLFELAAMADLVFGPLTDVKEFPADVDVTLVEGAVANTDNLEVAHDVRRNSRLVVAFGDCAVTGNVTALRNPQGEPDAMLQRVYVDAVDMNGGVPDPAGPVPALLPQVLPLHQVIAVDAHLPGCPPSPELIREAVSRLLAGTSRSNGPVPRFGV